MSDPRTAPYGSVRLTDVDSLAQVDPGNEDINDGTFHLVRRHFDVQAFGVNAVIGNAGDEMIVEHHELDSEENRTNGHQELFAVMTGHAVFTIDGQEIDAPAGTVVFVRDPALIRHARATADNTSILAVEDPSASPTPSRAGKRRCPPRRATRGAWPRTLRRRSGVPLAGARRAIERLDAEPDRNGRHDEAEDCDASGEEHDGLRWRDFSGVSAAARVASVRAAGVFGCGQPYPAAQNAMNPPSMSTLAPVMKRHSSEARKTPRAATSSGSPRRGHGVRACA